MNKKVKKKQEVKPEAKEVKVLEEKALKEQIKAMEVKKRAAAAPEKKQPQKVSFDSWFHLRKGMIPRHHLKEIIWSYFKSKGLSDKESIAKYDEELRRYGVKI